MSGIAPEIKSPPAPARPATWKHGPFGYLSRKSQPQSSVPSQGLPTVLCMDLTPHLAGSSRARRGFLARARARVILSTLRGGGGGVVSRLRRHGPPTAHQRSRPPSRPDPNPRARSSRPCDRRHQPRFGRLALLSPIHITLLSLPRHVLISRRWCLVHLFCFFLSPTHLAAIAFGPLRSHHVSGPPLRMISLACSKPLRS
jgi:hypothetical protein